MKETERIIKMLDSKICWECAETKPIFAHSFCSVIDDVIKLIKGEE